MATMTNEEIEQLQMQLKKKVEEVKEIYGKLVEAGAVPVPDDFLDEVVGGIAPAFTGTTTGQPSTNPIIYPTRG